MSLLVVMSFHGLQEPIVIVCSCFGKIFKNSITYMVQNYAAYFQVLDRKGTCVFMGHGGEVYA